MAEVERETHQPPQGLRRPAEVARKFPPSREGKPVHPVTVVRWLEVGVKLRDGSRRKLTGIRYPSGWYVTDEAVAEFLEALTTDRAGTPAPERPAVPRSQDRIEAELDRKGFHQSVRREGGR